MVLKFRLALIICSLCSSMAVSAGEAVNVYSYRQPFLIKPLFDAFTAETGIKVNVVFAKKGLVERLKREARNSPADVLLTADFSRLQEAVAVGVTQAVESSLLAANIPAQYRDPNGHWFGLTTRGRIIVVSKERLADAGPDSYEALADAQWQGRICTRSGKHVYMSALIGALLAHHGEADAEQWLQGVKANLARKPQGNDRAQVKAIAAGECDIAVINSYYMGAMAKDPKQVPWAEAVRIIFPNQADRGTHMNVSGMALTQSAPNKDNAIQLMAFLSSDAAQQLYAENNYEYPVKVGVPWSELLQSWGEFKADGLSLQQIAANRTAAIKLVDKVAYDD